MHHRTPKEGSGSFFFALAVRAIFAPVVLGLGLDMERSSLLIFCKFGNCEPGLQRI
jgi:hypothetical protein